VACAFALNPQLPDTTLNVVPLPHRKLTESRESLPDPVAPELIGSERQKVSPPSVMQNWSAVFGASPDHVRVTDELQALLCRQEKNSGSGVPYHWQRPPPTVTKIDSEPPQLPPLDVLDPPAPLHPEQPTRGAGAPDIGPEDRPTRTRKTIAGRSMGTSVVAEVSASRSTKSMRHRKPDLGIPGPGKGRVPKEVSNRPGRLRDASRPPVGACRVRRPDPAPPVAWPPMRRTTLVSPLLPALLLAAACRSLATSERPPVVRDIHSFAEPNRVRVEHVDLDLELDFQAREARGTAELGLARIDGDAPLVVDTHDLEILGVYGSDGKARKWSLGPGAERLGRPLTIQLEEDDERVRIAYHTTASSEAMQWLEPEQTAGGRRPFLFTQGQAILTRSWIPLQDSPGVRVTWSAHVRCPDDLTVVMSAERQGRDPEGNWRFRMDRAVPPYLIAMACGDLEFRAISQRCGVWAEPSVAMAARAELEDTESMVAAAEKLFGPYRWGRYDLLILPPSFPYGGMENPTLTFATPTILAGDKSLVALVAHELAHSWSGNLVTNATWSDFWLNEGFTVYCENRIMEVLYGPERAATERVLEIGELEDEMKTLEPWQQVLHTNLAGHHPDDGFSGVPYTKGALLLTRLEQVVGRERWDAFLRGWFDGHAFRSVTTADFLAYLEAQLGSEIGSVDLVAWTEQPGLPADAPRPKTASLTAVDAEVASYARGSAPGELATQGWTTQQWLRFLRGLPDTLTSEQMAALDQAFGFTRSGNSEILCQWLELSIRHRYAVADPELERFLHDVGRRKFLKPLYTALMETDPGRGKKLYEENRARYHSVSVATLDGIVRKSG